MWTVIDSVRYFAFTATRADVAKVQAKPRKKTFIKSGAGVYLYRVITGELEIDSANGYVFTWDGRLTT